jgi:hypothetical protein
MWKCLPRQYDLTCAKLRSGCASNMDMSTAPQHAQSDKGLREWCAMEICIRATISPVRPFFSHLLLLASPSHAISFSRYLFSCDCLFLDRLFSLLPNHPLFKYTFSLSISFALLTHISFSCHMFSWHLSLFNPYRQDGMESAASTNSVGNTM